MDLNRATILGRLTQDPEVRSTPSGQSVASLSVATNRYWTDKTGNKQEKAEFHNCVLWGKLADIAGQYLNKGRKVYLEGRIETRDWVGKDGVKRYRTEIIVDNMIMLDGSRGGSDSGNFNAPAPRNEENPISEMDKEEEIRVEDIPF